MQKLLSVIIISTLVSLLSACGFELRGSQTNNTLSSHLKTLYLQSSDVYNDVTLALERGFKKAGVQLADSPAQAPLIFDALTINYYERNITVGGNEQATQYIISYDLNYELRNQAGSRIYGPMHVHVQRYLATNANEVISNSPKLLDIQRELQYDLVQQVFYQLDSEKAQQALADISLPATAVAVE